MASSWFCASRIFFHLPSSLLCGLYHNSLNSVISWDWKWTLPGIHDSSARPVLQRAHCRALPWLLRRLGTVRFIIKLYSLLEFLEDAKTVNHWGKLNLECISHKLTGFNPLRVWVQIRKGVFKMSLNYSQFLSLCNNDVLILTPFLFLKDDLHSVPL